jgi:hypothetical protein
MKNKTNRTIILPVAYECDTWSLTLRGERKLRVFDNRVLRRIFGPKKDEVTGEWRKLHNEELNFLYSPNVYYSSDQSEKNEMGWACGMYGRLEICIQGSNGET